LRARGGSGEVGGVKRQRAWKFIGGAILLALALYGGSHVRFARILVYTGNEYYSVYRVCRGTNEPSVSTKPNESFIYNIYDRYGLRRIDVGWSDNWNSAAPTNAP
jgi:hypothetical protein